MAKKIIRRMLPSTITSAALLARISYLEAEQEILTETVQKLCDRVNDLSHTLLKDKRSKRADGGA